VRWKLVDGSLGKDKSPIICRASLLYTTEAQRAWRNTEKVHSAFVPFVEKEKPLRY